MPQGVEHEERLGLIVRSEEVRIPLMPQGVEHLIIQSCILRSQCEDSIDAARR